MKETWHAKGKDLKKIISLNCAATRSEEVYLLLPLSVSLYMKDIQVKKHHEILSDSLSRCSRMKMFLLLLLRYSEHFKIY